MGGTGGGRWVAGTRTYEFRDDFREKKVRFVKDGPQLKFKDDKSSPFIGKCSTCVEAAAGTGPARAKPLRIPAKSWVQLPLGTLRLRIRIPARLCIPMAIATTCAAVQGEKVLGDEFAFLRQLVTRRLRFGSRPAAASSPPGSPEAKSPCTVALPRGKRTHLPDANPRMNIAPLGWPWQQLAAESCDPLSKAHGKSQNEH